MKGLESMASDKFLSYSKFNKKYLDPIINNKNLINFNEFIYYSILSDSTINSLKEQYILPNPRFIYLTKDKYMTAMYEYTKEEKAVFTKEFNTLVSSMSSAFISLYPYPLNDFVDNFYSNYIPSEREYIINSLLEFNYIKPFDDYVLLSASKISKDNYSLILDSWKKEVSLNRIVDLMKEAQEILHAHKRDLSFLVNKVDELSEENKNLKYQNAQLTNNVVRANQITWS
jgi:hypothetical protein